MYIPRLRRINDALAEIKKADPDTEIKRGNLILLCKNKKITCLKYGNSWLINLDELYGYLKGKDYKNEI